MRCDISSLSFTALRKPISFETEMTDMRNILLQPGNKQALDLWRGVSQLMIQSDFVDLSARQLSILLEIGTTHEHNTVRGLAAKLHIPKASVCRALDTLSRHRFIRREVDKKDRRNVLIHVTDQGIAFLAAFSEVVMQSLGELS